MNANNWHIGQIVAVVDNYGRGREIYRGRGVRLTATQVLVAHEMDVDGKCRRFRRRVRFG